jgi:hypothetical protein
MTSSLRFAFSPFMVRRSTNIPILCHNPPRSAESDQSLVHFQVPSTAFNDLLASLDNPILWKVYRRVLHYCSFRRMPERDQFLKGLVGRLQQRVQVHLFLQYANIILTCPTVHRPYENTRH